MPILSVFGQVEDYAPFIDTLDYVFHTPGITAVEVTQVLLPKHIARGVWLATSPSDGLNRGPFSLSVCTPRNRSAQGDTARDVVRSCSLF